MAGYNADTITVSPALCYPQRKLRGWPGDQEGNRALPNTPRGKSFRLLWKRPGMTWEAQPSLAGGRDTLPAPVGTEPPQAPFQRGICARKRV